MKRLCLLLFLLLPCYVFSWGGVGHRLVAYIAYQRLTPVARQKVNQLTKVMFHSKYADSRFMLAAMWPDILRGQGETQYNHWHFINLPYVSDGVTPAPLNKDNIVWAISHSEKILLDKKSDLKQRALALSFLAHFVGDISQPLHCAVHYSRAFPRGDLGGNKVLLHSRYAKNLHQLWDGGLGLFKLRGRRAARYRALQALARKMTARYPQHYFSKRLANHNPRAWAEQSYQLATRVVYRIPADGYLSHRYVTLGRQIVAQQITLAGYRLAQLLNRIITVN